MTGNRWRVSLSVVLAIPSVALAQSPVPTPRVGGYIQARETYQDGPGLTASLNRARLSVDGTVAGGFSYRVLVEYEVPATTGTAAAGVSLRDAYIRWTRPNLTLTAGQFKVPFSREFITSITVIETADRAGVVDGLAPKRDLGVMAEYSWRSALTLSAGVFNGDGQNQPVNRDSTVMTATRLAVRPIPYLTIAANYARSGGDSARYGGDAAMEFRGALLRFEYLGLNRDGVSRDDHGWFALAAYRVLPWVQLVLKDEDFKRPSIATFSRNRAVTGGVNLDLSGGKVRVIVDYVSRKLGGDPSPRTSTVISQLQIKF